MTGSSGETQTILLTSHKGVDLHAASALRVMKERLAGGEQLENLLRCELHTYWGRPEGWDVARLLATGRYFNPNKHHFGVFAGPAAGADWFTDAEPGRQLPADWCGGVLDADLESRRDDGAALYADLLGGPVPDGCHPCDIVSFPLGETGPVLSGVVWRLIVRGGKSTARATGELLAVARQRKEGLLVNPHMASWFVVDQ